jgi:hypothetical protein
MSEDRRMSGCISMFVRMFVSGSGSHDVFFFHIFSREDIGLFGLDFETQLHLNGSNIFETYHSHSGIALEMDQNWGTKGLIYIFSHFCIDPFMLGPRIFTWGHQGPPTDPRRKTFCWFQSASSPNRGQLLKQRSVTPYATMAPPFNLKPWNW